MNDIRNIKVEIPAPVREILEALKAGGYEAYIVGGCVRDVLLERKPGDWDITTSALPEEVKEIFPHTVDTGIQHGTVMVLKGGSGYEVTTYRIDGEYKDSRHPESVTFTRSLKEDLKRRDFTINAFAWDEDGLIDLFDGLSDLENRIIRCVGDPDQRFTEDALRIMRAVRFSAQLGFDIDPDTLAAIRNHTGSLANISMERIRVEWEKTLMSDNPCCVNKYADLGMGQYIVQDLHEKCFDKCKEPLMKEIYIRKQETEAETFRRLMLAAFCDNLTPDETKELFRYLKYDNRTRDAVVNIIRYKDDVIPADRVSIKQALNKMGKETFELVLEFKEVLKESGRAVPDDISGIRNIADDVFEKNEAYSISQLAVNGTDLIAAGVPAGKKVGEILENILQKVIQSPTLNNREILVNPDFMGEENNER